MHFFRGKLYDALRLLNRRLSLKDKIICLTVGILLIAALIYDLFIINPYATIAGLILILLSIFLPWRNKALSQRHIKQITRTPKIYRLSKTQKTNQTIIDTKGGNYNENFQGNYIEGDYINQHVTIQDRQVELNSNISHTLDEFREILNQIVVQSSNPIEGISKFAQELAEELRNHPEVKEYFNANEDNSEQELVNIILKLLLTQNNCYKLNNVNTNSDFYSIEYFEDDYDEYEKDRCILSYKGYTIYIAKDQNDWWHYRIKRNDLSFLKISLFDSHSYSKELAISNAKKKVDEERFNNWQNSNSFF
ncbi:hypothetical protein [Nostoc sp. PA-18-2419]|uniref:hypothetical protein n=1 Tax=Nostoc sp. PA-18-2419 TaxID=2575443 RepID=UPI0011081D48|nr:hypothetical protein [Nostoc sp. PA-18-2419]